MSNELLRGRARAGLFIVAAVLAAAGRLEAAPVVSSEPVRSVEAASGTVAAHRAAPMSFDEALTLLHARADILRAHDAEIARADYESESAKWLGGPTVDIAAMQMGGSKTVELGLDTSGVAGAVGGIVDGLHPGLGGAVASRIPSNFSIGFKEDIGGPRASVNMVWPLYTGGAISAKQAALGHKATESRAERDAVRNEMDADLARKYWAVQLARSIEKVRSDMLADEERAVHRAKRFEKEGLISKIERMSVEVSRDAAKRDLVAAQTDTRVAETELMHGLREARLPELSTPLFVIRGDLGTLADWEAAARSSSPVLDRIDAQRLQAVQGVAAAESRFKPQVFAFGTKNLIKHYLTLPEPDWVAGIGVKFTLWSNSDRFASLSAAQSVVSKAEAAHAEARNTIESTVNVAFLRVTQAREEYDLTESTVKLARENLRLRESSFAEGLSTALDVSNARTQLAGAEIAKRVAAYKFVLGWAMLHAASGRMDQFVESLARNDLETEL